MIDRGLAVRVSVGNKTLSDNEKKFLKSLHIYIVEFNFYKLDVKNV